MSHCSASRRWIASERGRPSASRRCRPQTSSPQEQIAAGLMVFGICYRYGSPEQVEELFATALEEDGQLLHGLLVAYLPPQPHTPLLNPISRQGYARLAAIIRPNASAPQSNKHFPDAHGKVDQALAAPTGSVRIKQLMSALDGRAIEFLALHRSVREAAAARPGHRVRTRWNPPGSAEQPQPPLGYDQVPAGAAVSGDPRRRPAPQRTRCNWSTVEDPRPRRSTTRGARDS